MIYKGDLMKTPARFLPSTLIFLTAMLLASPSFALTAREIMEKSDKLPQPKTTLSDVSMKIVTGKDAVDKEFTLQAMRLGKNDTRALITFTKPSKIKLLTHTHPDREDDQWLMMTSGKAKRITSSGKDKSFVNSHFCYEDLSSRKLDDYDYKLLAPKKVLGTDCHVVEAVRKKGVQVYDKVVLYVRTSDWFVLKVDFYKDGKYSKTLENFDIRTVDGIITPHRMVMTMADTSERTELTVRSVTYNGPMTASTFNKEALR